MDHELLLLRLCALLCFASFAWGMIWHFLRLRKLSRTMLATALLAAVSAAVQLIALERRRVLFPVIALILYSASALLFWWAVSVTRGKLAACGQGSVSPEVVTVGPYRYVRHPFYTSYNLTWLAGFVATGWWPLAVAAIVMASLYERAAREEELGFSSSTLAEAYAIYKRRAGKYLPRIGFR
jgi:protein-S-isoprenylcysteine O-methyltransferase Ste14